jgi:uncharacterized protein (DUF1330 family)
VPAYVINDLEITDPQRFEEYKRLSPATLAAFGGRYLARGGEVTSLEGVWQPRRLVVLEFPSVERAQAWLNSPEYAPARRLRQVSANSRMVLIEGMPPT